MNSVLIYRIILNLIQWYFIEFYANVEYFMVLYRAISTFQPEFLHYISHDALRGVVARIRCVVDHPLEGALKQGLGGSNYVATGVTTKLEQYIGKLERFWRFDRLALRSFVDHVVVMRQGGFPIALHEEVTSLEEINRNAPENSVV